MSLSIPPGSAARILTDRKAKPAEDCLNHGLPIEELERIYRSRARTLADRLVGRGAGRDDGLDFIHEAFARLLGRRACRKGSVEAPEAYVAKISRNLLNDHGRTSVVRKRWVEQATVTGPHHHDQIAYLETRDTLRRIEAAVMKLRPRTRQIFLARRVEGLSYAEIAELTGLSVRTVENQMSKAIAKLSRLMDRG